MAGSTAKRRRAFLSYSYDGSDHRTWVLDLATRLRGDGVETILDKWELEPGDPLPEFMEKAVRENDFVLIICTPRYKERSDRRSGGVGYEEDIMTAEVLTERNHRKFKPVLRSGEWQESAPTWLRGKVYVDLRGTPYPEEQYQDLLQSLLGTRPKAPPVGARPKGPLLGAPALGIAGTAVVATKPPPLEPAALEITGKPQVVSGPHAEEERFEPIRILGVIDEEVGRPTNDGSPGSVLYEVPFQLSSTPPYDWAELFVRKWDFPPMFTSMHRPGIAQVVGDRIVLDGTTLEEVERYHRDTLKLAVQETNKLYIENLTRQKQLPERERAESEEHRRLVSEKARKIRFDE